MIECLKKYEYRCMFLSKFCYNFANALQETFGAVVLYQFGIPVYLIFLIYGLRFLITGLITPFYLVLSSRIGITKTILISDLFSILCAFMLLTGINSSNLILFIIVIGLTGLSNPSSDALSSHYIKTESRGKCNSLLNITKIMATALATILVSFNIINNTTHLLIFLIIAFFLLEGYFLLKVDYKPKYNGCAFKDTFNYLKNSSSNYKLIYSLRTNHIIERLFLPLYIFIAIKDFKTFSFIIVISLLFQFITVMITGIFTDRNINKTNNVVSIIKIFITSIFIFFKNKFVLSIGKIFSDNFEKVYETSIQTSIQNIIKRSNVSNELLSSVGQMSLCFTEVVIFIFLALISKLFGNISFIIMFILSIISTILIDIYVTKKEEV